MIYKATSQTACQVKNKIALAVGTKDGQEAQINPTGQVCGLHVGSGTELGTADGDHHLLSLPGGQVSLRISLEGRFSESHLGRVFLRLKPFLISASR